MRTERSDDDDDDVDGDDDDDDDDDDGDDDVLSRQKDICLLYKMQRSMQLRRQNEDQVVQVSLMCIRAGGKMDGECMNEWMNV